MKILFVALSSSVHSARWIQQLNDEGHEIHFFNPREHHWIHPDIRDRVVYYPRVTSRDSGQAAVGIPAYFPELAEKTTSLLRRLSTQTAADRLEHLIQKTQPDVIHSLEFQTCSYVTSVVKQRFVGKFPYWMVYCWGNDIYLFGRLAEHKDKIRQVLSSCDAFFADCHRDVVLAKKFGLRDVPAYVFPGGGGFPVRELAPYRCVPPSKRKVILVKGYQHWSGRAQFALRAIELIAEKLRGYEIKLYSAGPEVELKARLIEESTGLQVTTVPSQSQMEMMKLQGQSRVSLGLSISDGLPNTLLEAMIMGAFPVQSFTSCANEWTVDGTTSLLVPPEDPQIVAEALLRACTDDALVDEAAAINTNVALEKLDLSIIAPQVQTIYRLASLSL